MTKYKKWVLWSLAASFLIIGITVGYPIYRNDRALDRLTELGGDFYSQHHWFVEKIPWKARRQVKTWGSKLHGTGTGWNQKWAGQYKWIEGYDLRDTAATEEDLELLLRDQDSISWLWLAGTKVTGAESFRHLSGLSLNYIQAEGSSICDEAIEHLAKVHSIRSLDLSGTDVTETSVPFLIQIQNLKSLRVPKSFSDEALQKLESEFPASYIRRDK